MAIYANVILHHRDKIRWDDTIINKSISAGIVNEDLYLKIWSNNAQERPNVFLKGILQDAQRCEKLINILATVPYMGDTPQQMRNDLDQIRRVIVRGQFPEFKRQYVIRNSIADKIKEEALKLQFGQVNKLVVHGMSGCGKTDLVNQVLQSMPFIEKSHGAMFFVPLAAQLDTDNVRSSMLNLYLVARETLEPFDQDTMPAFHENPPDTNTLKRALQKLFLFPQLANAYVVLDDVKARSIWQCFNIGCKLIITAPVRDVAEEHEATFVHVQDGFAVGESEELLQKWLQIDTWPSDGAIKKCADQVITLCHGSPSYLNFVGVRLNESREQALLSPTRWTEIINYVQQTNPMKGVIENCVKIYLSEDLKEKFHSLGVFYKQVQIYPSVLSKLWGIADLQEIRNIMRCLEDKSLVKSRYLCAPDSFVYSVDDLVYGYLKQSMPQHQLKREHAILVNRYCDVVKGPNRRSFDGGDNYMLAYYGFHAKNADLSDKFDVYFDLGFVENKIKLVSSNDVLSDFSLYHHNITRGDSVLEEKLADMRKVVSAYSAHLHLSLNKGIVEFVLNFFNEDNAIYKIAFDGRDPDRFYSRFIFWTSERKTFTELTASSNVTSACLVSPDKLLVGTETGDIEFKEFFQYAVQQQKFNDHKEQILSLVLSPDGHKFLSISQDGTAKVWKLASNTTDPHSPVVKQAFWTDPHSPDRNNSDRERSPHCTVRIKGDKVVCATFPNYPDDEITVGTLGGKLARWDLKNKRQIKVTPPSGVPVQCLLYLHEDRHIIFTKDTSTYICHRNDLSHHTVLGIGRHTLSYKILRLTPHWFSWPKVVAICDKQIDIWTHSGVQTKTRPIVLDSNVRHAETSNTHLVMSLENDEICTYDFRTGSLKYFPKMCEGVPFSLLPVDNDQLTFVRLHESRLKKCQLDLAREQPSLIKDHRTFDCFWKDQDFFYPVITSDPPGIEIRMNHSVCTQRMMPPDMPIDSIVRSSAFCLSGQILVFGLANGTIYCWDILANVLTPHRIFNDDSPIFLIKTFDNAIDNPDHGIVLAVSSREVAIICLDEEKIVPKQIDIGEIFDIFLVGTRLIIVEKFGTIFLKSVIDNDESGIVNINRTVLLADFCHKLDLLAVITSKEDLCYLQLLHIEKRVDLTCEVRLSDVASCLSFSHSGDLLAIGFNNGNIEIFDLESREIGEAKYVLELHKSQVEQIVFGPPSIPFLISLGDQIAWWKLPEWTESESLIDSMVADKKCVDEVPYLLHNVNLGRTLKRIYPRADFKSFVIFEKCGHVCTMVPIL